MKSPACRFAGCLRHFRQSLLVCLSPEAAENACVVKKRFYYRSRRCVCHPSEKRTEAEENPKMKMAEFHWTMTD